MLLVLEPALKALAVHLPGPYNDPWDAKPGDRPDQLRARSFTVTGDPEVQAFAETNVVPGVMKLVLEVDEIHVHLQGHLQTKEELLG